MKRTKNQCLQVYISSRQSEILHDSAKSKPLNLAKFSVASFPRLTGGDHGAKVFIVGN